MQKIFLVLLGFFARLIIRVHKPYIIGITGTVGKTTISHHIGLFLSRSYGSTQVYTSPYHYNGEYGLPLTIIGSRSPGKNPLLWIFIFLKALFRLISPYPRYLVLEYGIDHPGEMDFLLSIVKPDIAILSVVAPNHLEQFGSFELYRKEKLLLIENTKQAIVHESLRPYVGKEVLFYGTGGMSDIDASHFHCDIGGVSAQIHIREKLYQLSIPAFGEFQIENMLPVYGVSLLLSLDLENISQWSTLFVPEEGRSAIIQVDPLTTILDGSYNGGYESILKGVESVVPFLPSHRVIFLLGDMRELGDSTRSLHEQLALEIKELIPSTRNVLFFLVGPLMRDFFMPKFESTYPVKSFLSSREAGREIDSVLKAEKIPTLIYVKGSQNTIFLEEGIKRFIDPKDYHRLCRQSKNWMEKKENFFNSLKKS